MPADFAQVAVFFVVGAAFIAVTLILAALFRPSNPSAAKQETYECGELPRGGSWGQFNVRYYTFALLFVIFDVETIFLYPWAVVFGRLPLFAFVEMIVFLAILIVGLAYAWRKGALRWW
jgi:NADH:ubiquinone oxidoreductase subunit 3 (subunit A)